MDQMSIAIMTWLLYLIGAIFGASIGYNFGFNAGFDSGHEKGFIMGVVSERGNNDASTDY